MRISQRLVLVVGAGLAMACGLTSARGRAGSYIVVAEAGQSSGSVAARLVESGATAVREFGDTGVFVVTSDRADFAEVAAHVDGVSGVAPNTRSVCATGARAMDGVARLGPVMAMDAVPAGDGTTEPFFAQQWGMHAIHAADAWAAGALGEGVRVAVIDTGIFSKQKDFAPGQINAALCRSFIPGESWDVQPTVPAGSDASWHGTHVAGIIAAAQNKLGTTGVAPKAELVAIKVLNNKDGFGTWDQMIDGIVYAADIGADVINMSIGGHYDRRGSLDDGSTADPSDDVWFTAAQVSAQINAMQRAVDYAVKKGATVVASAGNDGSDRDHTKDLIQLPAGLAKVICVSALGPEGIHDDPSANPDVLASYSNYGQSEIDLAAPGGDYRYPGDFWWWDMVIGPIPGGFAWAAGTSMAAPHVSGVAALIIGKNGGSMDPSAVESILRKSAADLGKPGRDDAFGHGRIDAGKAVK